MRKAAAPSASAARTAIWSSRAKFVHTVESPFTGEPEEVDLGFVGEPAKVDTTVLDQVLGRELIPVLAPIAQGGDGETYNVNADTFAGAIAGALGAKRLLFLTDVPGVLDRDRQADQGIARWTRSAP